MVITLFKNVCIKDNNGSITESRVYRKDANLLMAPKLNTYIITMDGETFFIEKIIQNLPEYRIELLGEVEISIHAAKFVYEDACHDLLLMKWEHVEGE